MTERFDTSPIRNQAVGARRPKRAWIAAGVGMALLTAGCSASDSSAPDNKQLVSSRMTVPAVMVHEGKKFLGKPLSPVTAHTKLDIAFTNCTSGAYAYYSRIGAILNDFSKQQSTVISSPKEVGVSCETVSTSLPDKLEVDVPLTSFVQLIPGAKRPTVAFTKSTAGFDEYESEVPTFSVNSGLTKARNLHDALSTSFKDYIHLVEGHDLVEVNFDKIITQQK